MAISFLEIEKLRMGVRRMYSSMAPDMARARAVHLASVIRTTQFAMTCNACSAALVVWAFRESLPVGLLIWWACLTALAVLTVLGWLRQKNRQINQASVRAVNRATWHAATLAAIWAILPLFWFANASSTQQLFLATLLTGMLGAGTLMLSPLPIASLAYCGIFSTAWIGALILAYVPLHGGVVALLALYAPMVAIGSLFTWQKATALISSETRAVQQEQTLAVLLEDFEQDADEALWETDGVGYLSHHSDRLLTILGQTAEKLQSQTLIVRLRGVCRKGIEELEKALVLQRPFRGVTLTLREGRSVRHIAFTGRRTFDSQGLPVGWRGVVADVTEKVTSANRLRQLALTDSLTGLPNRFTLRNGIQKVIDQGQPFTLLTIDLDHFKAINDTLGHSSGDHLLQAVAQRLQRCTRPSDLLARVGGDEFAILVSQTAGEAIDVEVAQRIVETMQVPVEFDMRQLRVGASVGVARIEESGLDIDEVLARSDAALYEAKANGRGRHSVYASALGERTRRRSVLEQELRQALERGQLKLDWQAKVDVQSWRIVGAEALMRWDHPEMGVISSAEFIQVAEQCGLIESLGSWALETACLQAAGPRTDLKISVNVSPVQFRDANLVKTVQTALQRAQMDPSQLELEITESVFLQDAHAVIEQLHALRKLGVRIALDDFGTGYSSLAYLRRYPFDTLKIDRSFVTEMVDQADARAIVAMISQLGAKLGMRIVAEGVETMQEFEVLSALGCHEVQGYLVSRPVAFNDFQVVCREWSGKEEWIVNSTMMAHLSDF